MVWPSALSRLVRVMETVARTASPSAPPTCAVVLRRPEASPESAVVASDMARMVSAGNDRPAPTPINTIGEQQVAQVFALDRDANEEEHPQGNQPQARQ